MIKVENLYFAFTKNVNALNNINFEIQNKEKVAFLGELDSGKTTLFRILAGLETYDKGEIFYNYTNQKTLSYNTDISVGYIPFKSVFFDRKTVYQNLEYVLDIRDEEENIKHTKIQQALNNFDLNSIKDLKINQLSLFQKIKVSLARVSMRKIQFFLIDNIFNHLTNTENKMVFKYVKFLMNENKDSTFLIGTQSQAIAQELCDRVIKLNFGSIVDDYLVKK